MFELLEKKLKDKRVAILGFGREGQSTYSVIRKIFPGKHLIIADSDSAVISHPALAGEGNLEFFTGESYLDAIKHCDLLIKSPGIRLNHLIPAVPSGMVLSQTSLFLERYGRQVIGVTGTKGKSTTSSLIHQILKIAGRDTCLVGNIGSPAFHFIDRIGEETFIVFELSSHQLEYTDFSPHVAILLNFFQEHLDAYNSYAEYQSAKMNIARFQKEGDYLIFHSEDNLVESQLKALDPAARLIPFSLGRIGKPGVFVRDGALFYSDGDSERRVWELEQKRYLKGEHNLKNIMAALAAACVSGIPDEFIREGILTFKGLQHRLEYVGVFGGIHFYNDSIATIPEAAIEALRSVPNVDTLILGGFDRGIDYSALASFLPASGVTNLVLVGAAGKRIAESLNDLKPFPQKIFLINRFDHLKDIVFRETKPGCSCLLSPAAASYDEFANFEERGKRFRELVSGSQERMVGDE